MWFPNCMPLAILEAWPGGESKGDKSFLSLPTPTQPAVPHTSQSGVTPAQPVPVLPGFDECHRVTIAKLGCQSTPGLETPPQLKGGTSGPSRHLYSAVIDVSQTSVTPSGGTQSAPTLSPASLFMSPPFIWQSKVYEPPRLFYPVRGPPGQRQALHTEAAWWAFTSRSALC